MEIRKIVNISNEENTYILLSGTDVAVIDPGSAYDKITAVSGEKIKYIILTHCHYDHIESLIKLKEKTGAKIVFSKVGKSNLSDGYINLSMPVYGKNLGIEPDILVSDGDIIKLGDENIKAIETPGHTSCGMCYLSENSLFSGDTLFSGSIGRSDLPSGNYSILEGSVRKKLYTLSDEIDVYPGHGGKTTIGNEKKYNSFIRG